MCRTRALRTYPTYVWIIRDAKLTQLAHLLSAHSLEDAPARQGRRPDCAAELRPAAAQGSRFRLRLAAGSCPFLVSAFLCCAFRCFSAASRRTRLCARLAASFDILQVFVSRMVGQKQHWLLVLKPAVCQGSFRSSIQISSMVTSPRILTLQMYSVNTWSWICLWLLMLARRTHPRRPFQSISRVHVVGDGGSGAFDTTRGCTFARAIGHHQALQNRKFHRTPPYTTAHVHNKVPTQLST